ncbi:hypothetical protein KUL113_03350 [Tenacibaculum sp. KUL113]|nr:hypothetical protein KUL113_03350 [Tenacibaculum sp. KUL113]GFD84238.1 hypothetical protein KUL150_02970 [Alteromonas sp. KUL150]
MKRIEPGSNVKTIPPANSIAPRVSLSIRMCLNSSYKANYYCSVAQPTLFANNKNVNVCTGFV